MWLPKYLIFQRHRSAWVDFFLSRRRRFSINNKSHTRSRKKSVCSDCVSVAVWEPGWGAKIQFSTPKKNSREMSVFWRAQISFFMSVLTREVVYPWAFPLWGREKIEKSRFWKWPFGSFWAPVIVSGWVVSCSRKVSMFSGEVRTVFWDSDFRAE